VKNAKTSHNEYTLFFRQISKAEYQNKPWRDRSNEKPAPFVSLNINAAALPGALRSAWEQLAGQDVSNIAEISFQGAMLKTDYNDPKRNLANMYYNAHMGLLPSKARLRLLNIAYQQYLVPRKEEMSRQWFVSNYGDDLVQRMFMREPEAFDEVYGSDFTFRLIEKGGILQYDIPEYVRALKNIKRDMSGYEGQMEIARNIHKSVFFADMPALSDIFIKEYFYGAAAETSDPAIKETLEFLLEDDSLDELRTAIDSGFLPGGADINEYIPVVSWEINERYYLIDYSGYSFLEERSSEVERCVSDAVGGNVSGLNDLLYKHKNDLRPFADYLGRLIDAGLFKEADIISSDLASRGIRIKHLVSDEALDKLRSWQSMQKSPEAHERESVLAKIREGNVRQPQPENKAKKRTKSNDIEQ
jgi:hypothetical protein